MKRKNIILLTAGLLLLAVTGSLLAGIDKKEEKTFTGITTIECEFALGNVEIVKSSDAKVHVEVNYTLDDKYFTPRFSASGKRLNLKEKYDNDYDDEKDGDVSWILKVPDGVEIDFNTGVGDIKINGCDIEFEGNTGTGSISITNAKGEYDINTGTNDIIITDCEGEFSCNTGTGKVLIQGVKGEIKANSGTGKVKAENITIVFDGSFNSGIADVTIIGPKGDEFDLTVNSGLGDAVVDLNGMALDGYLEMKCNVRSGKIVAPVTFDTEEIYGKNRSKTLVKTYRDENMKRRFYISTGTGKAVLKK